MDAVLAEQAHNPARALAAVQQLSAWVARTDWPQILPAYARCVRITRDQPDRYSVDPDRLGEAAERVLYEAYQSASARSIHSVDDLFNAIVPMIPAINRFFDDVLVMAEDPALRANRLGLLQGIAGLAAGVADLSKLEGF